MPIGAINSYITRIGKIPFIFVLFLISLFFWVNGSAFFPDWSDTYGVLMVYYIGMFVVFYIFSTKATENKIDVPINIGMSQFVFGFILSFIAITLFSYTGILTAGSMVSALVIPTLIMQFAVVAPAEELMFRGVLESYTGIFVQAGLFALWHSYAYGIIWYNFGLAAGIGSLIFAFIFGVILGYLVRLPSFGLPGVIAVHGVYNCILLGALAL